MNLKEWFIQDAKAAIFIIHGLGEHIGRYEKFAYRLNEIGKIDVFGFDLPGHGENNGLKGNIGKFEKIYEVIDRIMEEYRVSHRNPIFLFGHSLGGLIALRYVQRKKSKKNIKGLILSSPAFGIKEGLISPFLMKIVKILNFTVPILRFDNRIDVQKLSRNERTIREYVNDPLVHRKITVRSFFEILNNMNRMWEELDRLNIPVLIMYGTSDEIVPVKYIEKFYESINTEKEIIRFEEGFHEIFEDPIHEGRFYEEILRWIKVRL